MDHSSWQLLRLCNVLFRMVKASRAKACGHEGNFTLISRIFPATSSSNLLVPRYRCNQQHRFRISDCMRIVCSTSTSRFACTRVPSNVRVALSLQCNARSPANPFSRQCWTWTWTNDASGGRIRDSDVKQHSERSMREVNEKSIEIIAEKLFQEFKKTERIIENVDTILEIWISPKIKTEKKRILYMLFYF